MNELDIKRKNMRFIGVTKDATTAGPGKRLELFLKGCIRGIVNPCEGCFNPTTWEFGGAKKEMTVDEVIDMIARDAWNKQITFCGGEPLLQTRNLIKVCKALKERDAKFHIVIYTAYTLENLLNNGIIYSYRSVDGPEVKETLNAYSTWDIQPSGMKIVVKPHEIRELMQYIDLLVDGDYQANKRIPTEKYMNEGMFVGSANQRVIDTQETLKREPQFVFEYADQWMEKHLQEKHCECCGHAVPDYFGRYCSEGCYRMHGKRQQDIKQFN